MIRRVRKASARARAIDDLKEDCIPDIVKRDSVVRSDPKIETVRFRNQRRQIYENVHQVSSGLVADKWCMFWYCLHDRGGVSVREIDGDEDGPCLRFQQNLHPTRKLQARLETFKG